MQCDVHFQVSLQKVRDYLKIFHYINVLSEQFHLPNYSIVNKMFVCVFVCSFVCFLALRPRPTANVISGLSVILTPMNKNLESEEGEGCLLKYIY